MIDRRIQSTKSVKEIEARDADNYIAWRLQLNNHDHVPNWIGAVVLVWAA